MAATRKSKQPKKQAPKARRREAPRPLNESQAAEGVTVAWMLAALGTGASELASLLGMAALAYEPIAQSLPERADIFPWLLLFVSLITGTITLALTPLVLRHRQTPPPGTVVNFAIFVGVVAWTLAIGSLWFD